MSFMESIRTVLSKYADFNGRARRSEYWWYMLAYMVVVLVLEAIFIFPALGQMTAAQTENPGAVAEMPPMMVVGYVLILIVALGLLLPSLAVTIRRLHDSDKSGFFFLLGFIPFVGGIIVFVFTLLPGTPGPNRFGPDPKAAEVPAQA
ncbi:DUF805 domain-containing protein [Myceligenerans xiligouense]|uniref:Uncharacterized membrane protein YhaH (DUF805 family) n=1 Tax=Myceligenerans xiligouense TaxID=253184 RepID=A0A3N4YIT7_9MICO|nr:DUF805 domain-containing protein [Myceligenerans xiligouense]RPF21049.1 uncharacterized membrane protein YhaH (DUF805 family) [Myceligenerans xiligouense]